MRESTRKLARFLAACASLQREGMLGPGRFDPVDERGLRSVGAGVRLTLEDLDRLCEEYGPALGTEEAKAFRWLVERKLVGETFCLK